MSLVIGSSGTGKTSLANYAAETVLGMGTLYLDDLDYDGRDCAADLFVSAAVGGTVRGVVVVVDVVDNWPPSMVQRLVARAKQKERGAPVIVLAESAQNANAKLLASKLPKASVFRLYDKPMKQSRKGIVDDFASELDVLKEVIWGCPRTWPPAVDDEDFFCRAAQWNAPMAVGSSRAAVAGLSRALDALSDCDALPAEYRALSASLGVRGLNRAYFPRCTFLTRRIPARSLPDMDKNVFVSK